MPDMVWADTELRMRFLKIHTHTCVCAQLSLSLYDPMDCQTSLSMEFSRQEYWSGLPFPILGDWMEAASPVSPGGFFTTASPGKQFLMNLVKNQIWGWLNLVKNQVWGFITEHNGCYDVLPRFFNQGRKQINKHLNHLNAARKHLNCQAGFQDCVEGREIIFSVACLLPKVPVFSGGSIHGSVIWPTCANLGPF